MYIDALTLAAVADELRATLVGGRVQDVLGIDDLSVGLEIYAGHRRRYLFAGAHAQLARLHLSDVHLRRGVDVATPLLLLLRKWVRGARLDRVSQPSFERILRLHFDHPDEGLSTLIVEVMGRHSNVILADAGGVILECVKRIGADVNRYRVILPHQPYVPPPPQEKLPPDQLTELRLRQVLAAGKPDELVWKRLVAGIQAVSPLLAREAAFRAWGDAELPLRAAERIAPLLAALAGLFEPLHGGAPWTPSVGWAEEDEAPGGLDLAVQAEQKEGAPSGLPNPAQERLDLAVQMEQAAAELASAVQAEQGERRVACFAPYVLTHWPGGCAPADSISNAIERWVAAGASEGDGYREARSRLKAVLDEALKRVLRRQDQLREQLASMAALDALREDGELILAYGWGLGAGTSELIVDLGDGSAPRRIAVDPALSPAENAQAYFRRYQKAKRSRDDIPPLLEQVESELERIGQLVLDVELAGNRGELDEVRGELVEQRYLDAKAGPKVRPPASKPLSFVSPGGLTILVGRNSRQNDKLTFHMAKPDDWWFHARGIPGAHVVLRGGPAGEADILRAAELAAHYSAGRGEASVTVTYTRCRHVRRRPGGGPGQVLLRQEQTVTVRPAE